MKKSKSITGTLMILLGYHFMKIMRIRPILPPDPQYAVATGLPIPNPINIGFQYSLFWGLGGMTLLFIGLGVLRQRTQPSWFLLRDTFGLAVLTLHTYEIVKKSTLNYMILVEGYSWEVVNKLLESATILTGILSGLAIIICFIYEAIPKWIHTAFLIIYFGVVTATLVVYSISNTWYLMAVVVGFMLNLLGALIWLKYGKEKVKLWLLMS